MRLAAVRLFLCDVDGVLTDSSLYVGTGPEWKRFHIRDGLGMQLLQQHGIRVGWISFRPSTATEVRARELGIDFLVQKKGTKSAAVDELLERTGCRWAEVCFVGDDVVDLGVMGRAGVAVAVHDAIPEVRAIAHYTTQHAGGCGAIREAAELILKAQDKWQSILEQFSE